MRRRLHKAREDVTLHDVGGYSDGLQVVRIDTARGPVVLASDAVALHKSPKCSFVARQYQPSNLDCLVSARVDIDFVRLSRRTG